MANNMNAAEFRGKVLQSLTDIKEDLNEIKANIHDCNNRVHQNEKDIVSLKSDLSTMSKLHLAFTTIASTAAAYLGLKK